VFPRSEIVVALQLAATRIAIRSELTLIGAAARQLGQRLGAAMGERAHELWNPYRPELHYMRGPGPKWRQRHCANSPCRKDCAE
jgi:hypothetical protein